MRYNWQQTDWPLFTYSLVALEEMLTAFAHHSSAMGGMLKALPEDIKTEAIIDPMVSEAIKTSEIEGEYFSRKDVVSYIKKNLGLLSRAQWVEKRFTFNPIGVEYHSPFYTTGFTRGYSYFTPLR